MKTNSNDSAYPPGWEKKYGKSIMRYKELTKPLHEAKVAIQLCSMMEDALRSMDAHQASGLEEIGRLLHDCGLFDEDTIVRLPFSVYASIYLEEEDEYVSDMMSDYILATNEGAKTEDDYRRYDYILRHKPTVKALALERKKLYELINSIRRQVQEDTDKKMAERYASNKKWREQKQGKK